MIVWVGTMDGVRNGIPLCFSYILSFERLSITLNLACVFPRGGYIYVSVDK